MKTRIAGMKLGLGALAFGVCVAALGQSPVISSFSQNGLLVCANLATGSVASVEWASSVTGPWTNWAGATGLDAVTVASNGTITVSVPMFYRVRASAAMPANMALIPAGSFTMGGITNVYVSGFYMDRYEVTKALWDEVKAWNGGNGYSYENGGLGKAGDHPVHTVNWRDSVKWSNARSEKEGLTPCYYNEAGLTTVYKTGTNTPYAKWDTNGYRLPTEAEWEKAARGGLSGKRFPWGDTISESQANYYGNTNLYIYDLGPNGCNSIGMIGGYPYTSPVGYFAANGYGLYDMAGNVLEWCWDWYGVPYGQPTATNPTGPTGPLSYRVLRSGDWGDYADIAQCYYRGFSCVPSNAMEKIGFRCVRGL